MGEQARIKGSLGSLATRAHPPQPRHIAHAHTRPPPSGSHIQAPAELCVTLARSERGSPSFISFSYSFPHPTAAIHTRHTIHTSHQVWKDVDGVLTTDPRIVSNTLPRLFHFLFLLFPTPHSSHPHTPHYPHITPGVEGRRWSAQNRPAHRFKRPPSSVYPRSLRSISHTSTLFFLRDNLCHSLLFPRP
jgi:hypothetical protein